MKCEWCKKEFPHRKGRFCGTCHPVEKPEYAARRLDEMREECIDILAHYPDTVDLLDDAVDCLHDAILVIEGAKQEKAKSRMLALEEFMDEHGGLFGECAKFPRSDWKLEVANNDTSLGYWEWAYNRATSEQISSGQKDPS